MMKLEIGTKVEIWYRRNEKESVAICDKERIKEIILMLFISIILSMGLGIFLLNL